MFELAIISAMEERLLKITENIGNLEEHIGQELHDWQVQDMNRKYPETKIVKGEAQTSVWPRSRTNTNRRRALAAAAKVNKSKGVSNKGFKFKKRPILRPVLVQALHERMHDLGKRVMQWP